ncbi:MAG: hypothetical protein R3B09_13105 [Nannocystaceae bacterium]
METLEDYAVKFSEPARERVQSKDRVAHSVADEVTGMQSRFRDETRREVALRSAENNIVDAVGESVSNSNASGAAYSQLRQKIEEVSVGQDPIAALENVLPQPPLPQPPPPRNGALLYIDCRNATWRHWHWHWYQRMELTIDGRRHILRLQDCDPDDHRPLVCRFRFLRDVTLHKNSTVKVDLDQYYYYDDWAFDECRAWIEMNTVKYPVRVYRGDRR